MFRPNNLQSETLPQLAQAVDFELITVAPWSSSCLTKLFSADPGVTGQALLGVRWRRDR